MDTKKNIQKFKYNLQKKYAYGIVLSDYLKDKSKYYKDFELLKKYAMTKNFRNDLLVVSCQGKSLEMKINYFLFNMIFWEIKINLLEPIVLTDFKTFLGSNTSKSIYTILNSIIETYYEKFKDDVLLLKRIVSSIIEKLAQFANNFGMKTSNTFSIYDVIKFKTINKKFDSLLHIQIKHDAPIEYVEQLLSEKKQDMLRLIYKQDKNCFKAFVESGSGVKIDQLRQMLIGFGYRVGVDDTIIPYAIQSSNLKGYQTPAEIFLSAMDNYRSLYAKKDTVPKSGFLSKLMNYACMDIVLNREIADCNSKNYLEVVVKHNYWLQLFIGKWYLNEENNTLEEITKDHTFLIGKKIKIRSIISCALPMNKGICLRCYGEKYKYIPDIRVIGCLPSIFLCSPLSNAAMSLKHTSSTTSFVDISDDFARYFHIIDNRIFINEKYKDDIIFIFDKKILSGLFSYNNVELLDKYNKSLKLMDKIKFKLKHSSTIIEIENIGMLFTINESILDKNILVSNPDNNEIYLDSKMLHSGVEPYKIITLNKGVSTYLKMFISLIDGIDMKESKSYDNLFDRIITLIQGINLPKIQSVYVELLLYVMTRDINDIKNRPNFQKNITHEDYTIVTLSKSIANRKYLGPGLISIGIKRILSDITKYVDYHDVSIFDKFLGI